MNTITVGIIGLTVLIGSVYCLYQKKLVLSFLCSVGTLVLTYMTALSWRMLLLSSGKDTAFLGFHRYPAALLLLSTMLLAAFAVTIVSLVWMIRQNRQTT